MNITTLFQWAGLFLLSTFTAQISTGFAADRAFTNPDHLSSGASDTVGGGEAAISAGPMQPGTPEAPRATRPFDVLEQADGNLVANNPGQRWQVEFDGLGFTVSAPGTESDWGLELRSYGFGDARTTLQEKARVSSQANRVYYDREAGLREWFVNDDRGVEQGWTFQQRPEGHAGGGELMLELVVRGGLAPRTLPDGSAVCFTDETGNVKMTFGGLKAWDADGKALAVRFRHVTECPGRIRLTVEESLARYPITIDPLAQQAYLKANHLESQWLGSAVGLSGQTVVVGAPLPTRSPQVGRAYVFVRQNGMWAAEQTLDPVGGAREGDRFGWDLAISGDTVVIGAPQSDVFQKPDAGGAYVFARSEGRWVQKELLRASNPGWDHHFGDSVAIFNDTIVVGAPSENNGARGVNGNQEDSYIYHAGAVYVFSRAGATWTQQAYLKASNTDGPRGGEVQNRAQLFGGAVAISGNTILVGASGEFSVATNSGAVYVFVRMQNSWSQQAMLKSPNPQPNRFFGGAVALSGNTAVISERGEVHVFQRTNNQWAFRANLTNPDPSIGDNQDSFGSSVAISGDQILVGDFKKESSATGLDGDRNNNSAPGAGAAYLYHWNGTNWTLSTYVKASNTAEWDEFGWDVAMDGSLFAVGAPGESGLGLGVNPDQSSNTDPANGASQIGAAYVFGDNLFCQSVSDPSGSWRDSAGPLNVRLVFNERERLESGEVLHAPGLLGFNDAGQFAVIAAAECGFPSASSNSFMVRVNLTPEGPVKELSSFAPSPERSYRGLSLRDDGGVMGFDLYDSANDPGPPLSFARVWYGGAFQHLPGGLLDLAEDDALGGTVVSRVASASGSRYLVGLNQGGTVAAVVLDALGATLRTFPGVIPFRGTSPDYPGVGGQVAENGSFLGAPAANPGAVRLYRADGTSIQFGPTIEHARLSRDGTFVAYLDEPRSGNPSLVIRSVLPAGAPVMTIIPPSQRDAEVDAFEGWLDKDGARDIDVTEVSGGVSAFRDVLAIERLSRPLGDQIMTVVEALETNGLPAFYYLRSSAASGQVFASARLPRIPEAVYNSADVHSDNSTATLNRRGQVLAQEGLPLYDNEGIIVGRNLALSLFNANTFTKFKQSALGHRLTGLAANPSTRWFDQPVNTNLPAGSQKKFGAVGCTLTSMACISSLHGMEVSPLQVRDIMLGLGAMDANSAKVGQYRLTVGNQTLVRVDPIGGNFDTIVQELRGNHPVLLFVPNKGSSAVLVNTNTGTEVQWPDGNYRFNTKGHYIVAWGINPSLPVGAPVNAQDILISDPAYQYADIYGKAYATPGEELVHVTLHDYFKRIAADPVYSFDVLPWFNEGRLERMNEAEGTIDHIVLNQGDRDRQIQRWRVMEGKVPPNPTVSVNSPVNLAISVAGKRFVSDASLAGPGDMVLQKDFSQNIGEYDEDNDSGLGANDPSEEFPPYTLALPPELAGASLDFEIVGLASGSYTISLNPGKLGFAVLNSLQGTIAVGVTNFGRITVEGTANTNTFANWLAGYSGLDGNTGFSDDPDQDGIINGFECFFGTHPGQHSTGLSLMPGAPGAEFRHPVNPTSAADLAAHYEWSPDLAAWHGSGTTIQGVTVTLTPEPSSTIPGSVEVVPMITGTPSMLFYRIRLERLGP